MKIRDVIKLIENDGWYLVATKGSHRQFKHPTKPGRVTIAAHLSAILRPRLRIIAAASILSVTPVDGADTWSW